MLEKQHNNVARMQQQLKQLQEQLARDQDEKQVLQEMVQNVGEEISRCENKFHIALRQQQQLKHSIAQQLEKEKKENCALNAQLTESQQKCRKLQSRLREQKEKQNSEMNFRLTRKRKLT